MKTKRTKKFPLIILMLVLISVFTTGCGYLWNDVETHEVGAKLNRNQIQMCVGPGNYTGWGWFDELKSYSIATLTFEVEDPEVATADNQLVGVRITIQARRKGDCEATRAFFSTWAHLLNDDKLKETIDATAREGIKNGVRGFTLTELLNDRNGLAIAISDQLKEDAGKYSTDIVNVTIENVAISTKYAAQLQKTAQLKAQEDFQDRRQALIEKTASADLFEREQQQLVLAEQLKVERAQTDVNVEIATREGKVIAAKNAIYIDNEYAFQLERLRLLANVLNGKTIYFMDTDAPLTLFLSDVSEEDYVPVPVSVPAPQDDLPDEDVGH